MDLRRPSIHVSFDLPNGIGMADVLQGKAAVFEALQSTPIEGLHIISSGAPFPDPGRLVESDQMGEVMSDLKTRFDVVILDSAPVLVKSDAIVLARHVGGVILVLESEKTTRRAVRVLMDVLSGAHIKPLGFILNRLLINKGKPFYHQYYYGPYGREVSASQSS